MKIRVVARVHSLTKQGDNTSPSISSCSPGDPHTRQGKHYSGAHLLAT